MVKTLHHFINGKLVEGKSGRFGDVFNPATGEKSAQVPLASAAELGEAVAAAKAASPKWIGTPPLTRARILFKFKQLADNNLDKLAELVTLEHGKTFSDAKGSVSRGLEVVEFATGIPQLLKGEFSENVGTNVDSWSIRQPIGVCRRHHAVQLPGHGADVDVPDRARLRQHLHPEAVGERAVGLAADRAAAEGGRPARRRAQRRATATRRRSTPSCITPTSAR